MSPASPVFMADNGDLLTREEARAITALQRLGRNWPRTLMLVSMDGGLSVVRTADPRYALENSIAERQECILAHINGIRNDGGGW